MYILLIWTLVAVIPSRYNTAERYDWRPAGEYTSEKRCEDAADRMGKKAHHDYQCVLK